MNKKIKTIVGALNIVFAFVYALALVNGKVSFMDDKFVFIQFAPLCFSLVVAIIYDN